MSEQMTTCQACGKPTHPESRIDVQFARKSKEFRTAIVCEGCLELMDADQWVLKDHWDELNPKVKYEDLPPMKE